MDVGLVCDACSALTPIGVPQCARCGESVALDPRPTQAQAAQASTVPPGNVRCVKCASAVPAGQKFCPNCGHRQPDAPSFVQVDTQAGHRNTGTAQSAPLSHLGASAQMKSGRATMMFGGAVQSARAKLTLIRGDGEDGVSFTLAGQDHQAGRGECPISFPDDTFLSPTHANFLYRQVRSGPSELVVRDEGSLNGVYVRISGTVPLTSGMTVLIGEQVLTVSRAPVPEDAPDQTGTYYSASIPRPATLEIKQSLRGGTVGWVFRVNGERVVLGREGNDINFPDDPFISGRHAEIRVAGGQLSVTDLGSRNGTFVRIQGEQVLKHGDYVFLGQQLLRVEIV